MSNYKKTTRTLFLTTCFCLIAFSTFAGWRRVDDVIDIAYEDGTVCYETGYYFLGIKWSSGYDCDPCC